MELIIITGIVFGFLAFALWLDYLNSRHRHQCDCDSCRDDLEGGDVS